jgi:hypothetical protein
MRYGAGLSVHKAYFYTFFLHLDDAPPPVPAFAMSSRYGTMSAHIMTTHTFIEAT